ncbi:MAG: hypothetical protein ABIH37_01975 [archaeon]
MIFDYFIELFNSIYSAIPEDQKVLVNLFVYTVLILIYALFIWKFYKFLAKRDIIELNLRQYEYALHPVAEKSLALFLYILEYLIILPFLVLFWFSIFSIFLLVLSESGNTQQILLISAAIITSVRVTSYISEDLSRDLAKILPFTILAAFIIGSSFFNLGVITDKIMAIPGLFNHIIIFLIFIFAIEFIFRIVFSITQLFTSKDSVEIEAVEESK